MPLKLPRYVFRRANGSFRYKRNVPLHPKSPDWKATLYRQLGDSYKEAMQNLPLIHARIEALLEGEKEKSARDRSIEIIGVRWAMKWRIWYWLMPYLSILKLRMRLMSWVRLCISKSFLQRL